MKNEEHELNWLLCLLHFFLWRLHSSWRPWLLMLLSVWVKEGHEEANSKLSLSPLVFLQNLVWVFSFPCAHAKASLSCCRNAAAHRRTCHHGKVPAAKAEEQLLCECKSIQEGPSLSTLLSPINFQSYGWILVSLHCCLRAMDLSCSCPAVVISLLMQSGIFR